MMFYFTLNAFVFFFSSESLRPPVYTIIMAVLSIMGFVNGIMTMRLLKFFGLSDFIFSAAISSVGLPLFVYTCLAIEVVLNAKSGGYSTRSLWWSLATTIIWTFVNSAFCFAGAYKGYTMKRLEPQAKVSNLVRPIPAQPARLHWMVTMIVCGGFQYLSICTQFSAIMQSMWRAKLYTLFWFLLV